MEREHPVDSRSAKTALVLREGARKNHYTESFKLQATTRQFSVSRPFQPQPLPRAGRGTLLNSKGTTYNPQVAPENASFRVRAHEKTITQMTVYRIFTPGHSARHAPHGVPSSAAETLRSRHAGRQGGGAAGGRHDAEAAGCLCRRWHCRSSASRRRNERDTSCGGREDRGRRSTYT